MKVWQRPFFSLLAVFSLLGLFAWWIFQAASLPPVLRDLFQEDEAVMVAATPLSEEEKWQAELAKLPAPPQEHPPEVTALLERLRNLPPIPYVLATALAREAATPADQTPPPWTEDELGALTEVQQAYLRAWEPFLQGPAPDWPKYPDSILLFRSSFLLLGLQGEITKLMTYRPGKKKQPSLFTEPQEVPELMLPLLRHCRNLGSLRFGQLSWNFSETIRTTTLTAECLGGLASEMTYPREFLENLRRMVGPAPTLLDLRAGLLADRAFFLRTADFLGSLPPSTPADAALFCLLQDKKDTDQYLQLCGNPQTAAQLAAQLRLDAEQLEILRQKTFLAAPAWRQWLSGDPGRGLSPLLAQGLEGFRQFEDARMSYLVALAGLDARLAWEQGGVSAVRRIPDPAKPGAFLTVEEIPEGLRILSVHIPSGKTTPVSYVLPTPAGNGR